MASPHISNSAEDSNETGGVCLYPHISQASTALTPQLATAGTISAPNRSALENQVLHLQSLLAQARAENQRLQRVYQDALRGAIFLERPDAEAKLGEETLACIECYKANRDCNPAAVCHNCRNYPPQCKRLRCARQRLCADGCPDLLFCELRHDEEGWLLSDRERARW